MHRSAGALLFVVVASIPSSASLEQDPTPKAMFYNPFGVGTPGTVATPINRNPPLKAINWMTSYGARLRHCGVHYWLESERLIPVTEAKAREMPGTFSLHVRASCNGFLTVWDVGSPGIELTPREGAGDRRFSGYSLGDRVYTVPGMFRYETDDTARHLIVVWARAQSEVARTAVDARERVKEMLSWKIGGTPAIVTETDESTPGEIGTYVVNRADAGVPAEISFRRR